MEYVTPEEVAERLKVSRPTVYQWVRQGKLESARFGRTVRITRDSYERFIEEGHEKGKAAGRISVQAA